MKGSVRTLLWWVLGIIVISCVVIEVFPRPQVASRIKNLPLKGVGFQGRDLPLNAAEETVFRRAAVVKRLYLVGNERFVLLAIDGGGDRHAIHDPLYCFRGAGWAIAGESDLNLAGGQARLARLQKGPKTAEAVYWVTDGQQRNPSALTAWWLSASYRLGFRGSDRSPVLVLLQPVSETTVDWQRLLDQFTPLSTL